MLILQRNINEKLYIGKNHEIVVTVCRLVRNGVSLGIDAPKYVPIIRDDAKNRLILNQHVDTYDLDFK